MNDIDVVRDDSQSDDCSYVDDSDIADAIALGIALAQEALCHLRAAEKCLAKKRAR